MADRRLQVFATVARLLSFTRAAEALHMTQPAVTFQIRQLEEHFNTRLFDRSRNRIALTEAGELVRAHADDILARYLTMDNELRALTGEVRGTLIVGASTTVGEYFIPAMVGAYQATYPQVRVRLVIANTGGVLHLLNDGAIDVGVVEGPVSGKALVREALWDDELVTIFPVGHALAARRKVAVGELAGYPFISREEGSGTREVMENYLAEHPAAARLNIVMEFGSSESIKSAVGAGLGISILSVATMEKELVLKSLAAAALDPPLRRAFSMITLRDRLQLPALQEFLEFAREHCRRRRAG